MSVLFTYGFEDGKLDERIDELKRLGYTVYYENESDFKYKDYMKDIEVLVTFRVFDKVSIDMFPKLKWIQLTSMGFEQVPVEVVERGITVTNNKNGYSIPMGEWTVLNILELMKNRRRAYKNQEQKKWSVDHSITELYEKKVLFVGTGDTAYESAKRLKCFDVKIGGINTDGRAVEGFDKTYSIKEIDSAINNYDVVVIALPHTKETHHLFDKSLLSKLRDDAYLINISRGKVIKEEDLVGHLESGYLSGAALDVFEHEPLSEKSKLWDIERVVITPHNSWISEKIGIRRWNMTYENFKRFKENKELLNKVRVKRGY